MGAQGALCAATDPRGLVGFCDSGPCGSGQDRVHQPDALPPPWGLHDIAYNTDISMLISQIDRFRRFRRSFRRGGVPLASPIPPDAAWG